jgi:HEAT repeat protein
MNDLHNFFNHVDDNLANSTYRIFEEQSKAEILAWFKREDVVKEQKEDFIQALVDFKDDCGDFYSYRAYFLAAEALNYFKDCSLGDAIASQILKWSYSFFRQDKQDWQIVPQPLVEAARATLEKTDKARVIPAFVHLVHTTQSRNIRRTAAEKLGKLDPGNKSAIAALFLLLQVPQDDRTLWNIVCSLMQIDPDNPAVISNLVKLTQANTDRWSNKDRCWHTIKFAIDALGKVGLGNQIAINALVHLLQTKTNSMICNRASTSLSEIATGNKVAIDALIKLMQTTASKDTCWEAIICLGKIATGNRTTIAAFTEFLQTNQGNHICIHVAKALWQIDKGNVNAIAILVQMVAIDKLYWSLAASYLREITSKNTDVISALTERIATADESVRCDAAASLLKFEPDNEVAIATLLRIPQSSNYIGCRQQAADSLLNIDPHNQVALHTLFSLIEYLGQSPPDPEYVSYIAWVSTRSLQKIDPSNQLAIAALINLLNTAQKDSNLYVAVGCLGDFAAGNKDAIAALTKLICFTEDNYLLLKVAYSLGRIDPGNQKAFSTLIEFIQSFNEWDETEFYSAEDERSRSDSQLLDAVDKLQEILPINQMPQVITALKDYLNKFPQDSSCRYEACYNLIWHCAQNMTYPDFFEAWHKSP